jgi:DNA-binding XRE family transcriptional regulator
MQILRTGLVRFACYSYGKVGAEAHQQHMNNGIGNYLRVHRRNAGLSQHELGQLIGYSRSWQISRHESSQTIPPLLIGLAYEAVFGVAVSAIFAGIQETVAHMVEQRIAEFEKQLQTSDAATGEKKRILQWLRERRVTNGDRTAGS